MKVSKRKDTRDETKRFDLSIGDDEETDPETPQDIEPDLEPDMPILESFEFKDFSHSIKLQSRFYKVDDLGAMALSFLDHVRNNKGETKKRVRSYYG